VSLLIKYGANVNAKNSFGDTPMNRADAGGQEEIIRLLKVEE